ncbi:MAG: phospho-N-acetylmuramoyl-pentapeptide-transferase [Actinomycetota bacterium]|nr:phospho-N-acetylmuramoyl-pentapeptide-transferase [Actinomycetota bacterium]
MIAALVGTPVLIGWLQAHGVGQQIREDGPKGHVTKAGTPTMGGLMIVVAALVGYLGGHMRGETIFTWAGLLVAFAVAGAGVVGVVDDWIKVRRQRSLGLNKRAKITGQLVVAVGFAVLAVNLADVKTDLSFTRWDSIGFDLGSVGWAVWAVVLMIGTSNAVNLTDGLDGLAAGSSTFAFSAFAIIGFWQFRHFDVYRVPQALDLAVLAVSLTGACAGFLWWNAAPARIFMGDTGSLAIGAGLAAFALVMNVHLLLPVVGGLYVLETLSVIIQVGCFRLFHRRVLRMAPVHHHFELMGWPETTVIVRFWILAGLCTALALGLFYADFISLGVLD